MSASGVPGAAPSAVGLGGRGGAGEQLLLPFGQRLGAFGLRLVAVAAGTGAGLQTLGDRSGDHPGEQRGGADRVVVARDRVVDQVGIAVGVEDRDDRDVQLASLRNREVLLIGVDDPDRRGHLDHVADTAEAALQLVLLAGQHQDFLLGATLEATGLLHRLELLEALQPLVHGGEVGEHAAQPALVHVGHADAGGLLGDGLLRLLLGADEHDAATVGDGFFDELVRLVDVGQRLLQVDDVDAVAVGEDEPLHLGIPATGLMPEVGAAVKQLLHGYNSHFGHVLQLSVAARRRVMPGPGVCCVPDPRGVLHSGPPGTRMQPSEDRGCGAGARSQSADANCGSEFTRVSAGALSTAPVDPQVNISRLPDRRGHALSWAYARGGGDGGGVRGVRGPCAGRRRQAELAAAAATSGFAAVRCAIAKLATRPSRR